MDMYVRLSNRQRCLGSEYSDHTDHPDRQRQQTLPLLHALPEAEQLLREEQCITSPAQTLRAEHADL